MKKRIFSLLLALVLCLSLVSVASAGTASRSGTTSGGTKGRSGISATLFVNAGQARSTVTLNKVDSDTEYISTITYHYTTETGVSSSKSEYSDYRIIGVAPVDAEITSASSYHNILSELYGHWNTSLSASS